MMQSVPRSLGDFANSHRSKQFQTVYLSDRPSTWKSVISYLKSVLDMVVGVISREHEPLLYQRDPSEYPRIPHTAF